MTVHLGHLEPAIVVLVLVRILTFWSITGWYWFLFHVCISLPASMLELARLIVDSKWVPPQPVIFLFNGAEELFLLVIPLSLSLSTQTHTERHHMQGHNCKLLGNNPISSRINTSVSSFTFLLFNFQFFWVINK